MPSKNSQEIVFSCIFLTLLVYTIWASTKQSVLQWGGLTSGSMSAFVLLQLLRLKSDEAGSRILTAQNG